MGIAKNHPIFNWIKCQGMLFHDTLNKVREDQAYIKFKEINLASAESLFRLYELETQNLISRI